MEARRNEAIIGLKALILVYVSKNHMMIKETRHLVSEQKLLDSDFIKPSEWCLA